MSSVFLLIMLNWPGTYYHKTYYPMPTMKQCLQIVKETKFEIPNGSDNEHAGVVTCVFSKEEVERD